MEGWTEASLVIGYNELEREKEREAGRDVSCCHVVLLCNVGIGRMICDPQTQHETRTVWVCVCAYVC